MYLDFIKDDYREKSIKDRQQYIDRDKMHLAKIIQTRITDDIENIVNRWYELDDIGIIDEDAAFLKLLKESEELYSFGYYIGSISLVGVASEELCKFLIEKYILGDSNITHYERINLIFKHNKINKRIKDYLHQIRLIRNKYIHFKEKNLNEDIEVLKKECYKVIDYLKLILQDVLNVKEINYEEVVNKLISNQEISFTEFKYKHRNFNKKINGLDLQLDPSNSSKIITDIFRIAEIDIKGDQFKELTLVELQNNIPVIIDLTIPQVLQIQKLKLEEKNIIVATIISSISSIGQTEEWLLLNIDDVFRGNLNF